MRTIWRSCIATASPSWPPRAPPGPCNCHVGCGARRGQHVPLVESCTIAAYLACYRRILRTIWESCLVATPLFATSSAARLRASTVRGAGPGVCPTCAAHVILHANQESCLLTPNLAYYLGILRRRAAACHRECSTDACSSRARCGGVVWATICRPLYLAH